MSLINKLKFGYSELRDLAKNFYLSVRDKEEITGSLEGLLEPGERVAYFLEFRNSNKTRTYKFDLYFEAEIARLVAKATKANKDETISLYSMERK